MMFLINHLSNISSVNVSFCLKTKDILFITCEKGRKSVIWDIRSCVAFFTIFAWKMLINYLIIFPPADLLFQLYSMNDIGRFSDSSWGLGFIIWLALHVLLACIPITHMHKRLWWPSKILKTFIILTFWTTKSNAFMWQTG